MKLFLVETFDKRIIRHHAESAEALSGALEKDYRVVGQVIGANSKGDGGLVINFGDDAPTLMDQLLEAYGDNLLVWLGSRGIKPNN
jgi:hypothetical protein